MSVMRSMASVSQTGSDPMDVPKLDGKLMSVYSYTKIGLISDFMLFKKPRVICKLFFYWSKLLLSSRSYGVPGQHF